MNRLPICRNCSKGGADHVWEQGDKGMASPIAEDLVQGSASGRFLERVHGMDGGSRTTPGLSAVPELLDAEIR